MNRVEVVFDEELIAEHASHTEPALLLLRMEAKIKAVRRLLHPSEQDEQARIDQECKSNQGRY
ncbi:MAG: hypothetical protein L0229_00250 [Blastocatellia bacterium]|nr:hypothetical protein [Blastocatellia bacterium]